MSDETNQIDLSQIADKALQKNLANILRKLGEGKTLNAAERKMFEKHKKRQTDADLADLYNCDERTIRNWRKDGAPLHDADAMPGWLASRKNVPPGTGVPSADAPIPIIQFDGMTEEVGAPAAMRRLAEAEVNAAKNYQQAMRSQNPILIKNTLNAWLETVDALRKYDSQIEASRRDSGELLPRAELERILRSVAWYLRISGQQAIAAACEVTEPIWRVKEPWEMNKILCRLHWETLMNTFASLASHADGQEMEIPGWAIQALSSDLEFVLKDVPEVIKRRAEAIEILVKHNAKQTVRKLKAHHDTQLKR